MSMVESKVVSRVLLLAMAMAAAALFAGSSPAGAFEICGQDPTNVIQQCEEYVKKDGPQEDPSQACCAEVQKFDVTCVCQNLPPVVELIVSMEKAVYVARFCGKKIPAGTTCGDYVVPPVWRGRLA